MTRHTHGPHTGEGAAASRDWVPAFGLGIAWLFLMAIPDEGDDRWFGCGVAGLCLAMSAVLFIDRHHPRPSDWTGRLTYVGGSVLVAAAQGAITGLLLSLAGWRFTGNAWLSLTVTPILVLLGVSTSVWAYRRRDVAGT